LDCGSEEGAVDRAKQAQAIWEINLPGMNYECDRKPGLGVGQPISTRRNRYLSALHCP
jgi:hypothetical protein